MQMFMIINVLSFFEKQIINRGWLKKKTKYHHFLSLLLCWFCGKIIKA